MLILFLGLGLLVYAGTMKSFFVSDDFVLVDAIQAKTNPFNLWVIPRFIRPIVTFSFFIDFNLWGLDPAGYHLSNIIFHSANSFLVFMICLMLYQGFGWTKEKTFRISLFTGLMFLVFAGHSESVSWISGRTDVLAVFFTLLSFFFYLRFRESRRPLSASLSIGFFILALLSKESIIVYPFILLIYHILVRKKTRKDEKRNTSTGLFHCGFFVTLGFYFGLGTVLKRFTPVFESFDAGFAGMMQNLRMLLVRMIFPYGSFTEKLVKLNLDFLVLIFAIILFFFIWKKKKERLPVVLFLLISSVTALLPPINFGVSLVNSEGERFLYFASVFFSMLVVMVVESLIIQKTLKSVIIGVLVVVNLVFLLRSNVNWENAGILSKKCLDSAAKVLKTLPSGEQDRTFILNLPDSVNGAYVFRNGFYESLHLFYPAVSTGRVSILSTHSIAEVGEEISIEDLGHETFVLDLKSDRSILVQLPASLEPFFKVLDTEKGRFKVQFERVRRINSSVLSFSNGTFKTISQIEALKGPFGHIDFPENEQMVGEEFTLEGWVLSESRVIKVEIKREPVTGDPRGLTGEDGLVYLGKARIIKGTRPDIVGAFPDYPFNQEAGWILEIKRGSFPEDLRGKVTIHVFAYDEKGYRTRLGMRTIIL